MEEKFKTYIVLISVEYSDSRKTCELIEDTKYQNFSELKEVLEDVGNDYLVYSLTDFMDEVNNQYLDVLTEYFISYVHIKEI